MSQSLQHPWMDRNISAQDRAKKLVAAMTLEEKIEQLHGNMQTIDIYALTNELTADDSIDEDEAMAQLAAQVRIERHVKANDRLGIPRFRITNGPVGVGMGDGTPSPPATALPMTIGVAASFDPKLAYRYGDVIGSETATLGQHVLEGPAVCLHRSPIAGRNFEYFSEDPYLSGIMGVEITKAIQSHDVIAMVKHFALNDQEYERFRNNVEVAEHVMRELYLLPFEMVIKDADCAAVMAAYNRVRGHYASENRYLLHQVLRQEWGFKGYVQSDFWSCRSCSASLTSGLDHEMPDAKWFNEKNIKSALQDSSLEIETIDRALVRRFTQMLRFNQFEKPYCPGEIDAKAHGDIAREMGREMAVLLKNDARVLPLSKDVKKVAIIGQSKFAQFACQGGGGSSKVDPLYTVDPLPGMQDVLADIGSQAQVQLCVVEKDLSNMAQAKALAAEVDVVVIMAGLVATEGADMAHPRLPNDQDTMVAQLLGICDKTVVVLKSSSPMCMPWIDQAHTVLEVWNQGSEDGHVVAELLWGVATPGGKVPTTYARREEDLMYYGDPVRYPGTDEGEGFPVMRYTEGLKIGYRWFQSENIKPAFPFGYGLSYTTFDIDDIAISTADFDGSPVKISARITNTGDYFGSEVLQVYLGIAQPGQPPKRLVGFAKAKLAPSQSENVTVVLDPEASSHPFSVWDYETGQFQIKPGEYTIYVGTSSEDTLNEFTLNIP